MATTLNETRPFVILRLSKKLKDVLKHDCEKCGDGWLLNSSSEIGNLIQALVTPTLMPTKCTLTDDDIKVYLPISEKTHYIYERYYIYVKNEHQQMIAKYIDSVFQLRVGQWFLEGRRRGYRQTDIINAIIAEYGLWDSEDNHEMLKKMDYRQRKKVIAEVKKNIGEGIMENDKRSQNPQLSLF